MGVFIVFPRVTKGEISGKKAVPTLDMWGKVNILIFKLKFKVFNNSYKNSIFFDHFITI